MLAYCNLPLKKYLCFSSAVNTFPWLLTALQWEEIQPPISGLHSSPSIEGKDWIVACKTGKSSSVGFRFNLSSLHFLQASISLQRMHTEWIQLSLLECFQFKQV